jgi:protein-disulfide isomerase
MVRPMRSKVLRFGFVTTMVSAVACSGSPTPQPTTTQGATAENPADGTVVVATNGQGNDSDKSAGPKGIAGAASPQKRRAGRGGPAAEGDSDGFAGEVVMGGVSDEVAAPPPPPVVPAELAPWTGGNEIDAGFGAQSPIPVTAADPSWGSPQALVTIVVFSDLECPFCARVLRTMDELRKIYGKDQLRIVWKNYPLAFHKNARPAAEAAMAVFALRGSPWFFAYHDALFSRRLDQGVIDGSLPKGLSRRDVDTAPMPKAK